MEQVVLESTEFYTQVLILLNYLKLHTSPRAIVRPQGESELSGYDIGSIITETTQLHRMQW